MKVGGGIQAILGGKADIYSQEINDILAHPDTMPKRTTTPAKVENKTEQKQEHQIATLHFAAPVNGKFIDLTKVADEVFSKKMMGEASVLSLRTAMSIAQLPVRLNQFLRLNMLSGLRQQKD
ncbi:PTS system glucose-specific EIICBA component [Lactobacillus helveticus]|uniref:PTS system glucose-specific EIICBA component n=1 Tax=Lactobacillus helveticus TaxID=1587 RepID=A0A3S8S8X8_LACHE|nr:PTS system glucose-specific EIICBA component [Lactobacillus helveticus]NRO64980.1 PTS system glucose-specific EIICBA component [Lactobacillus helveticus]